MSFTASGESRGPPQADRAMIGTILTREGATTPEAVERALKAQRFSRARLGDILSSIGLAQRGDVTAAAARQRGMRFVRLSEQPPDPVLLHDIDIPTYLDRLIMPWRREGQRIIYVAGDPEEATAALPLLNDGPDKCLIALAEPRELRSVLVEATRNRLARRAEERRPLIYSLRKGASRWQKAGVGFLSASVVAGVLIAPIASLVVLIYLIAAIIGLNGLLWLLAAFAGRREKISAPLKGQSRDRGSKPPPRISLLIALYREAEVAPLLVDALSALNYPPELLDVKLILEADDAKTGPALEALDLPPFIEVLVTPEGGPQTKPRALNFAMEFVKGDIIGVYDAEDRPHPDQLKEIAEQFERSPPEVACIQARLGFYNIRENLLTRFFEIEYASWFDVMLPGLHRLGLPIPLGGTSFFIKRGALAVVGGWDSHNVTEDADLGVMLARAGMQTGLSSSLTEEEASSRPLAWIKQRSRWLKGYLATWITHMAHPFDLWRGLGAWRFLGLNVLLLSAVLGYLALPVMWMGSFILLIEPLRTTIPEPVISAFSNLGAVTILCIPALICAAWVGLGRRRRPGLMALAFLLPLYWALGAVAAFIAVFELITAPSVWRKTEHGVGRIAAELRSHAETKRRS